MLKNFIKKLGDNKPMAPCVDDCPCGYMEECHTYSDGYTYCRCVKI